MAVRRVLLHRVVVGSEDAQTRECAHGTKPTERVDAVVVEVEDLQGRKPRPHEGVRQRLQAIVGQVELAQVGEKLQPFQAHEEVPAE